MLGQRVEQYTAWSQKGAARKWRRKHKARGAPSAMPRLKVLSWESYLVATWMVVFVRQYLSPRPQGGAA